MALTNRPKTGDRKEPGAEPLKRSVAGCLRAIAKRPDIEVTYASDRPALIGDKARLPEPTRRITAEDAAILRGHSDSMALRLGCHDTSVHRRLAPDNAAARAVYDAVEQARVEAIGSRRLDGVAANITAMLEDRYHRGGKYENITDRADAPMEDAIALMVRERLTGQKPPPAAARIDPPHLTAALPSRARTPTYGTGHPRPVSPDSSVTLPLLLPGESHFTTPDSRGFSAVDTWVFDLDNTLYPSDARVWPQVDERITLYVMRLYGLDAIDRRELRR